jgi:hypothetical protein
MNAKTKTNYEAHKKAVDDLVRRKTTWLDFIEIPKRTFREEHMSVCIVFHPP